MANNILLITGSDTGIGKTYLATALVRELVNAGLKVGVVKAVETGCCAGADGELVACDGEKLRAVSNIGQSALEVTPLRYEPAVAPTVAAAAQGSEIDIASLVTHIKAQAENCDLLVVEGAGGLLVPLAPRYTFADLALELAAQTLLVVGSRLGALNHASLTFEVLRGRGINTLGYLFNDLYREENPDTAEREELLNKSALQSNRQSLLDIAAGYEIRELAAFSPGETVAAAELAQTVISSFNQG